MSHLLRKSTKSVFFKSGFEAILFQRRKESAYKTNVQLGSWKTVWRVD
jgi:hypothetical protein